MPGFNEDFQPEAGKILVEQEEIDNEIKGQKMTLGRLRDIVENDDFGNWDYFEFDSMLEVISFIDNGFRIINLKEEIANTSNPNNHNFNL